MLLLLKFGQTAQTQFLKILSTCQLYSAALDEFGNMWIFFFLPRMPCGVEVLPCAKSWSLFCLAGEKKIKSFALETLNLKNVQLY